MPGVFFGPLLGPLLGSGDRLLLERGLWPEGRIRSGCALRHLDIAAGGKDYVLGRLDPIAVGADACADADGAENGAWAGFGLVGAFDEELGGEAQVFAAALEKAGGACVTIDGAVIRELVVPLDEIGIVPAHKILFDFGAVWVVADVAFAGRRWRAVGVESSRRGKADLVTRWSNSSEASAMEVSVGTASSGAAAGTTSTWATGGITSAGTTSASWTGLESRTGSGGAVSLAASATGRINGRRASMASEYVG